MSTRTIGSRYICKKGKLRDGASVTVAGALQRAVMKLHLKQAQTVEIYSRSSGMAICTVYSHGLWTSDGMRRILITYHTKKQYL